MTGTTQPNSTSFKAQHGFALPLTIFLITLVTILLGVAFARSTIEFEIADGSRATVDAYSVAKSGLESFFGDTIYDRPGPGDSLRYNVVGGYAWVAPIVVKQTADTLEGLTYLVRSTGHIINAAQGPTVLANRTVAQFARWRFAALPLAAHVAFNGMDHNANPLTINGSDACVPGDTIMGYRAVNGDSPPIATTFGNPQFYIGPNTNLIDAQLGVDWSTITSGSFQTDFTTAASINGATYASFLLSAPTTYLNNVDGTGLLIVEHDLRPTGVYFRWKGVILVGGRFNPDVDAGGSSIRVDGVMITGLKETIGINVFQNRLNDTPLAPMTLQYDSCEVHEALKRYKGFRPINNTVIDNWASY